MGQAQRRLKPEAGKAHFGRLAAGVHVGNCGGCVRRRGRKSVTGTIEGFGPRARATVSGASHHFPARSRKDGHAPCRSSEIDRSRSSEEVTACPAGDGKSVTGTTDGLGPRARATVSGASHHFPAGLRNYGHAPCGCNRPMVCGKRMKKGSLKADSIGYDDSRRPGGCPWSDTFYHR